MRRVRFAQSFPCYMQDSLRSRGERGTGRKTTLECPLSKLGTIQAASAGTDPGEFPYNNLKNRDNQSRRYPVACQLIWLQAD